MCFGRQENKKKALIYLKLFQKQDAQMHGLGCSHPALIVLQKLSRSIESQQLYKSIRSPWFY